MFQEFLKKYGFCNWMQIKELERKLEGFFSESFFEDVGELIRYLNSKNIKVVSIIFIFNKNIRIPFYQIPLNYIH